MTYIHASTSTAFRGTLSGDPATGVVRATNAIPAGTYTVSIIASSDGSSSTSKTFSLQVAVSGTCAPISFRGLTLPAGLNPEAVAVGDFNSDGKEDIALSNNGATDIAVFLGAGDGSFSPATSVAVGSSPHTIALGDFNGDGKQDLAVAVAGAQNVTILLGDGAGNFTAGNHFAAGATPESVAVGDFNDDGKQDLAVANGGSSNVSILLGDGAGNFGPPRNFGVSSSPQFVVVGDFNGDGKQDLAVANAPTSEVSVLLGDGSGNFSDPANFAVGPTPRSIAVGDFNGDSNQDLAVANFGGSSSDAGSVSILIGDGEGNFAGPSDFNAGQFPISVAIGDFDGDGNQDVAVANNGSLNTSILLGDGAGHFGAPETVGSGNSPTSVAVGDFDGNGAQDLAVTNSNDPVSIWLRECPPPTPTPSPTATPSPTPVAPRANAASAITASTFAASWKRVTDAAGYRLDVSSSSSFSSYIPGYQDLEMGNVTNHSVTQLSANTIYYYRLRAYNGSGASPNSNVIKVKTKKH